MSGNRRRGKIVTAGHSTMVEGLAKFLPTLEAWDEIETIRVGHISNAGRSPKPSHSSPVRDKERSRGAGGGFSFRITRWAQVGTIITGIKGVAAYGKTAQEVYLTSTNYPALRARLVREGYLQD